MEYIGKLGKCDTRRPMGPRVSYFPVNSFYIPYIFPINSLYIACVLCRTNDFLSKQVPSRLGLFLKDFVPHDFDIFLKKEPTLCKNA